MLCQQWWTWQRLVAQLSPIPPHSDFMPALRPGCSVLLKFEKARYDAVKGVTRTKVG